MMNNGINGSYSASSFTSQVEPWEQQITRTLTKLLDGQKKIMSRIDKIEGDVEAIQKEYPRKLSKISIELQKIAHRTGCIKDLTTNVAAHTLNTSRKIHGAQSVLDPVKKFRKDGYKDWSIRPGNCASPQSFNPFGEQMMAPMAAPGIRVNPFGKYGNNVKVQHRNVYPQQIIRSPAFGSQNQIDHEEQNQGTRTPVFGSKTPEFGNARYEPYQNIPSRGVSLANRAAPKTPPSPYAPTSPTYTQV